MRLSRLLMSSALVGLMWGGTAAQADTLEEALIKAYDYHPSLEVSRAAVRAADEGVPSARAASRPSVTASGSANITSADRFDGAPADSQSLSITTGVRLFDGGDTANAVEAAIAGVAVARANLVGTEQQVLLNAVTAYGDVRRDTQFVSLARNNVRVISSQLQAARDRFEVGEVTRTVVAQAQARLAAAQSNLVAQEGALARSREAYIAAIGEAPGDLAPPPALPALPGTLAEAEALAMNTHPSIVSAQETLRQTGFNIERARASFRPTLDLSGTLAHNETTTDRTTDTASLGLSASLPIYRGGALPSSLRRTIAQNEQAKAQLQDSARVVRLNVASAWANLDVSRASITAARQQITAARVAFEGVQEEARLGARTTLDVLDAEQDLLDAQSSLVASQRDEYVAVYSLLAAMGLLTVDHLGLAVDAYDPSVNYDAVQNGPFASSRGEALDRILGRYSE